LKPPTRSPALTDQNSDESKLCIVFFTQNLASRPAPHILNSDDTFMTSRLHQITLKKIYLTLLNTAPNNNAKENVFVWFIKKTYDFVVHTEH
jgi:hypothetical protein